ncbi:transcriptional Coactivator p15-domain-containing protein [Lasiosphaeria hispida]|uniref:Transcriptional Coactivator p15-domain-containing protein n=1 Tax=Lasiosphaeria hispida TaxID=260671 RepID=A0AAJ0MIP2_9PEZI|nr:transcriptional Coactivator p15-domain-containing protein [Lasiosphaeria hispida]
MPKKRQVESDNDDVVSPVVKKAKAEKVKAKATTTAAATSKDGLTKGKDGDGNSYWEIGNKRRVSASSFKGAVLVNIREYYQTPDGEDKPGKKGISLNINQYRELLKIIPELNEQLRAQGEEIANPDGSAPTSAKPAAAASPGKKSKAAKKTKKANIEMTSDEDNSE